MIASFLLTLQNILLPIFIQIALGFGLKKLIHFKIDALVNIQFYLIIPALLFTSMFSMTAGNGLVGLVVLHTLALVTILFVLSLVTARLLKYSKAKTSAVTNCVILYNSGNFSIPLVQLLYSANPLAMSIQMVVMMITSIMTNTLGIFNASRGSKSALRAMLDIFKVPMIYSVLAAFLLRGLQVEVWPPVWNALDSMGKALVPIALITLGAQLAETRLTFRWLEILPAILLRLIISPAIALLLVKLFGLTSIAASVVIITSAAPSAVNAVLLAIKYDNEPALASEAVFISTLLSSVTVAAVINLVGGLAL